MAKNFESDPGVDQQTELLQNITDNMQRAADVVAGHHETTVVALKRLAVPEIGLVTYTQIGHQLEMKFMQQLDGQQTIDIKRNFDVSEQGCTPVQNDPGFSVYKPDPDKKGGVTIPVTQEGDQLHQNRETAMLTLDELAAQAAFAATLAEAVPAAIEAQK